MPTPKGTQFDSVEEAESYYHSWPRVKCTNPNCKLEMNTFPSAVNMGCPECSIPGKDSWQVQGILGRMKLEDSDPYLFPDKDDAPEEAPAAVPG
jgi:hypothetical protein